jgi:hypothetical protein
MRVGQHGCGQQVHLWCSLLSHVRRARPSTSSFTIALGASSMQITFWFMFCRLRSLRPVSCKLSRQVLSIKQSLGTSKVACLCFSSTTAILTILSEKETEETPRQFDLPFESCFSVRSTPCPFCCSCLFVFDLPRAQTTRGISLSKSTQSLARPSTCRFGVNTLFV